ERYPSGKCAKSCDCLRTEIMVIGDSSPSQIALRQIELTQRPQMVEWVGFTPMSVSQCQQRSHFWPSARLTSKVRAFPLFVGTNLRSDRLRSSRSLASFSGVQKPA